jgi:hypothetical protein
MWIFEDWLMQGERVMGNALNCTNMGLERDKLHLNFYEHFLNIKDLILPQIYSLFPSQATWYMKLQNNHICHSLNCAIQNVNIV